MGTSLNPVQWQFEPKDPATAFRAQSCQIHRSAQLPSASSSYLLNKAKLTEDIAEACASTVMSDGDFLWNSSRETKNWKFPQKQDSKKQIRKL